MSKKKNDQNFISELLGKLKASYSSPEDQNEPPAKKDTGDAEFQKQLEKMLEKSAPAKPAAKKAASPKRPQTKKEAVEKAPPKNVKKPSAQTKISKKQEATPPVEEPLFLPAELLETPAPVQEEPLVTAVQAEKAPVEETVIPQETVISQEEVVSQEESLPQEEAIPASVSVEEPIPQETYEAEEANEPVAEPAAEPKEAVAVEEPKKKNVESDPIVIRPKQAPLRQQKSIVIRPRTESKPAPTPTRVEPQGSEKPIRIGRKSQAPVPPTAPAKETARVPAEEPKRTAPTPIQAPYKGAARSSVSKPQAEEASTPAVEAPVLQEQPKQAPAAEVQKPTARAGKSAAARTFSEQIHQKTGLSEDEVALLFELGYDGDLANLVGPENLKKLKSANLRNINKHKNDTYPTAIGYRGKEYAGTDDQSGVLAAYVHDRKYLIARLILMTLSVFTLLLIEVPSLYGARWVQLSQSHPALFPIAGVLLLLITAALSAKQLWAGMKDLISFSASPYSVCFILIPPTLIYNVLAFFLPAVNLPVNFLVALTLLATSFCDVFRLWGELRVFRLLARPEEKHVLEEIPPRKKKMKYGDKIIKILNDDVNERFYRVSKARNVTGFFRRFNTAERFPKVFSALLFTAFLLPFALAFAVAVKTLSFSASVNAFISLLILGAPISAVFGVFYPIFHANQILTRHRCALIGEESAEEYCRPKTLIFEDSEMFQTEKCTEIALDESGDFQTDMKLATALFRKIGSTLAPLGQAVSDGDGEAVVSLLHIPENGVEATVNDRHLLAGDAGFLKRYGIRVPKESSDRAMRRTKNVRVMYVAIDGVLKLSYEIEYTEKLSFERIAEALSESKTAVAIKSYDPNLNTAFLGELANEKGDAVRVIKPGRYEENVTLDLVDTGAISLDAPEKTVCALHAAAKIGKLQSLSARLQLIATLLGSVGSFLLILFEGRFLGIPHIALYHLFWIALSIVATHLEITEEKLHLLK